MKLIKGDLLEGDWDYACHITNQYKTFGSGIAYFIKRKYPSVYQADLEHDIENKLGTYSYGDIGDSRGIYNIYAMDSLGNDGTHKGRNCRYDALIDALDDICTELENNHVLWDYKIRIGVPYLMGCCRAGGSWTVVDAILKTIEEMHQGVEFIVYDIENDEGKVQSTLPDVMIR